MTSKKIIEGPKPKTIISGKTIGQLFFEAAEKHADKICQIDASTNQTETYASLRKRSTRLALNLLEMSVAPEDVVVVCTGNSIDAVVPIVATFYVGATVASLDPSLSVRQMQHLLTLSLPKIIFVEQQCVQLIEESLKAANFRSKIIVYGQSTKYPTLTKLTRPKDGEEKFKPAEVDLDEIAVMFFSSGTTGLPKAICHSHRTLINIGCTMYDTDVGDCVLHFTSFYWITAMMLLMYSQIAGGTRVFCRSFDPETTFKAIEKYKVTMAFMAPNLAYQLLTVKDANKYDTSSVQQVHLGGAQINHVHFEKIVTLFKHSSVLNAYGMSEVGYISCFQCKFDGELIKTKTKSTGKPIYGLILKVVDEETNEALGPNQKGEIRVKSYCLFKGYFNADSSYVFDEEGFLKTGDVGYYDEEECIYVVARTKEMFKYQSWHVVPTAIEEVLLEHPAVKEAGVFGVPCGDDGEAPGACIVLEQDCQASEKEIYDYVAARVSDREKLRGGITFVTSLPKTPTGKIMRKQLRDMVVKS